MAQGKTCASDVRIGWYETPFNVMDKAGRRSGYAYEYQQKLAAYSGWNFTYVKGSWSELMQKLFDGEIDMMSDVSYTEERAEKLLYPELPMGTEEYCIFIVPGNRDITSQDYSTLNGKRIGVYKNSVHADIFLRWAELHGIHAELVELVCTETEALDMLDAGKLDAYVTPNAYSDPDPRASWTPTSRPTLTATRSVWCRFAGSAPPISSSQSTKTAPTCWRI